MMNGPVTMEGKLPEAFECDVRGRMALSFATIELHDYRFGRPQDAIFQAPHSFLDLALSPRPRDPRGHYFDMPGTAPRPMGDVIFIPAGHGLSSQWGAGLQSSVCCAFHPSPFDERDEWTVGELDASLDVRSVFVRDALVRLAREIQFPGFCAELMAEAICSQLAIELGRYFRAMHAAGDGSSGGLSPSQLRHIEERLDCCGKPPTVVELARECGLSPRHFFRMFRATTGMTLSEFAADRRVASAKSLLASRKPPVKEIAYRCGFATAAAFSAAFRRATGVTPREYRREMLG